MTEPRPRVEHALLISTDTTGARRYEILCTGPDDNCREYWDCACGQGPAYDTDTFDWLMSEVWFGYYHGVQHLEEYGWLVPGPRCSIRWHSYAEEEAADLTARHQLPDGVHPVRVSWEGFPAARAAAEDDEFFTLSLNTPGGTP